MALNVTEVSIMKSIDTSTIPFTNATAILLHSGNLTNDSVTALFDDLEDSTDLSDEIADTITFVLECVTMPILISFGITGNVLSLIVLSHRRLRRSTTTYLLIGLAVSDCLYLISTMVRKSTCIISRFSAMLSYKYFVVSFSSMYYINTCFSRTSTLIVAAISVERLIAVIFPLKVKLLCTKKKIVATILSIFIFTFAFLSLLPLQLVIDEVRGVPILRYSNFYKDNYDFIEIYNEYITVCVLRWVPKVIVVMCNAIIIRALWKRHIPSETMQLPTNQMNYPKTQRKVSIMLVTVAIIFVLTLLPGDAFWIAAFVDEEFSIAGKYKNYFTTLSDLTVTFEIINASINFIVYMLMNSTFSQVYKRLFCPCIQKSKLLNLSSTRCRDSSLEFKVETGDQDSSLDVSKTTIGSSDCESTVRF